MGRFLGDLLGTISASFGIGPKGTRATLSASSLTANRTLALPDAAGTLALQALPMTTQSGTTYTLVAGDANTLIRRTSSTLNKVLVDCTVFNLTNGPAIILIQQVGTGLMSVDVSPGSGGTMNKGGMTATAFQRGSMMYIVVDTSTSFYTGGEVKYL